MVLQIESGLATRQTSYSSYDISGSFLSCACVCLCACLCSSGDCIQGLTHVRYALPLSYIPGP